VPSSAVIDGSALPFEEVVTEPRRVVDQAGAADGEVLVEAELGRVAGEEAAVATAAERGVDRYAVLEERGRTAPPRS
jgi:fructose/tagatose bisphosphate aldolase